MKLLLILAFVMPIATPQSRPTPQEQLRVTLFDRKDHALRSVIGDPVVRDRKVVAVQILRADLDGASYATVVGAAGDWRTDEEIDWWFARVATLTLEPTGAGRKL